MNKLPLQKIVKGDYGRKIAYSSVAEVNASNVLEVAQKGIAVMHENKRVIEYLQAYKKGDQPAFYRKKTARDDINNPTVENHAYEIVQFEVGQTYGEPVQCVALKDDNSVNASVDKLNDYYRGVDKQTVDIEVGEWVSTCGVGYKAVQRIKSNAIVDDASFIPFRLISCEPMTTGMVYSRLTKEPLLAIQEYVDDNNETFYVCYSSVYEFVIKNDKLISSQLHAFGDIPIVEYRNNSDRISSIELVASLLDGLNELQSSRIDGVDQFVQSFFKFVNCEIDEETFKAMKMSGAFAVKSNNGDNRADVDLITQELNQTQSQTLKDDIYDSALEILAIPNREGNTGGDTQGAVSLRNGWDAAKLRAKTRDPFVVKSEKKIAMLVLNILRQEKGANDCPLGSMDFDINIVHSPTDNLLVKAESLEILLRSGVHPLVAIRVCGLWSDAEKTYIESKPYLDNLYKTIDDAIKQQELDAEVAKAQAILSQNTNNASQTPTDTTQGGEE